MRSRLIKIIDVIDASEYFFDNQIGVLNSMVILAVSHCTYIVSSDFLVLLLDFIERSHCTWQIHTNEFTY